MANKSLSQQTAVSSLASGDLVAVTDVSDTTDSASGTSKKTTMDNVDDYLKSTTKTLTNKTLTSPVINTPTGIVKGDVGLGNVDNTSDATKNAASVTLTNKTITDSSNNVAATNLVSSGGLITVSSASSPSTGQVLTATSAFAANWQTPASATSIPCCVATKSSTQAMSTSYAAITFDGEDVDTDTMHDNSVNTSRITIKTAGTYLVGGCGPNFTTNVVPYLKIRLNATTDLVEETRNNTGGVMENITIATARTFAVNDYIELFAKSGSGTPNANATTQVRFWAYKIG